MSTSTIETKAVETVVRPRYLATDLAALPENFVCQTAFLPALEDSCLEKLLRGFKQPGIADRVKQIRRGFQLFRCASRYKGVVTCGNLEGLIFAMLQRLRGEARAVNVMYDCLWYGGGYLKRAWMRYCLKRVDRCVVWASIEIDRYSKTYHVKPDKFLFVPHHHTTKRYKFEVGDDGYVFTGGNWSRDYKLFVAAVRELNYPFVIATTRAQVLLAGIELPPHVRVVAATHEEFRQLIARSSIVVLPMQADELHAGGQQTFLNAMLMGKPVVLTDPAGGRDYIEDGVTGRLIPYKDEAQLAASIRELMSNPEKRALMGDAAKKSATPLTTEACNTRIWAELDDLIRQKESADKGLGRSS